MKDLKIIDCTIRDGGHLNKWHFEDSLVKASYFAASKCQVDYFEIGYKNDPKIQGVGPYGICNDQQISSLFKSQSGSKLLCMIDAGKYTGYEISECTPEKTPFTGVRVATYPHEVEKSVELIDMLSDKGYGVFLQLMASSQWAEGELESLSTSGVKTKLEAVYFADSFGSYVLEDITAYVNKLKDLGFKDIGFHSHNNLQMGFANSMQAIANGARYIDASIFGMGRGAGNLPIEILLSYLKSKGHDKYNVVPYLDVIERYYLKLMSQYHWGYSLKTLLSGIKNIHPYYVDELLRIKAYTIEEIWDIIDNIQANCPISYSKEKLDEMLDQRFYKPTLTQAKKSIHNYELKNKILKAQDAFKLSELAFLNRYKNRHFVIIANGSSIKKYSEQIKGYIKDHDAVTIGTNYLMDLYRPDYHAFVSKKRFLKYAGSINPHSTLLVPTYFGKRIVLENYTGRYEYLEIEPVTDENDKLVDGLIQQPVNVNVAITAVIAAYQMGANQIDVVGMDGYDKDNADEPVYFYNEDDVPEDKNTASLRYESLVIELKRVHDFLSHEGIHLSIITPTSHKKYFKEIFVK